jgi:hypothetical protein
MRHHDLPEATAGVVPCAGVGQVQALRGPAIAREPWPLADRGEQVGFENGVQQRAGGNRYDNQPPRSGLVLAEPEDGWLSNSS